MDERKKEDLSVQDVEVVPVKKKRKKISISMILCVVFLITTGIFWSNSEENSKSYAAVQKQYDKSKNYYLIIRDLKEDVEVDRIPFTIDMAFQDGFDFF